MQGQVQMLHVGSQAGVGIMTRSKHLLTEFLQLDYEFTTRILLLRKVSHKKREKAKNSPISHTNQRHKNVHPWPQEAAQQVT